MVTCLWPVLVLLAVGLAGDGQVEGGGARGDRARSARTTGLAEGGQVETSEAGDEGVEAGRGSVGPPLQGRVIVEQLNVHVRPDEQSYVIGTLGAGGALSVRKDTGMGWTVVAPPPTAIGWMERTALELGDEDRAPGRADGVGPGSKLGLPLRARVVIADAEVRAGQLRARMPGPPWLRVPEGTVVELVDRPPVAMGQGADATLWFAIAPPKNAAGYALSSGLQAGGPKPRAAGRRKGALAPRAAGFRAEAPAAGGPSMADLDAGLPATDALPPNVRAEIGRADAMRAAMVASRTIDDWRFDAVRDAYQAVLGRAGDQPAVEEALRARLALVTRLEQAARAARTFSKTLNESRSHDVQVDRARRALARADRANTRTFDAVGFIQPSSRTVEGRRLHVLVGPKGTTIAYLDVPPGIDLGSLTARRVGVFGTSHYNRNLESPLISVRDMEMVSGRARR